jgi:hypothetical protein
MYMRSASERKDKKGFGRMFDDIVTDVSGQLKERDKYVDSELDTHTHSRRSILTG